MEAVRTRTGRRVVRGSRVQSPIGGVAMSRRRRRRRRRRREEAEEEEGRRRREEKHNY